MFFSRSIESVVVGELPVLCPGRLPPRAKARVGHCWAHLSLRSAPAGAINSPLSAGILVLVNSPLSVVSPHGLSPPARAAERWIMDAPPPPPQCTRAALQGSGGNWWRISIHTAALLERGWGWRCWWRAAFLLSSRTLWLRCTRGWS